MSFLKFCGFNGFSQFKGCSDKTAIEPTDFELPELEKDSIPSNLLKLLWSFNLYASGNFLIFSGFCNGLPGQIKKINLNENIKQITSNENICLILVESNKLFKYDYSKELLSEVIFQTTNSAIKRSIFGEHLHKNDNLINNMNLITHIACSVSAFVAVIANGSVYCLPTKIFQFPHHFRVKNLCSGFEHFLILNNNGDVYSWGNGSRGQLGHVNLDAVDCPQIIDALAGIKIIAISAGGWHSAAISAFGDLYVWGNNVNGQLGICIYKLINLESGQQMQKKNPTIHHLPEVIDIDCNCSSKNGNNEANDEISNCSVISVNCGARHSIVQMSCGKILGTGWNNFNQLGFENKKDNCENIIDKFIPIDTINSANEVDIICGHWCTVFILK